MSIRQRSFRLVVGLAVATPCIAVTQRAHTQFLADFSPDTTGVPIVGCCYTQRITGQYLADKFTLASAATVTGGSNFSNNANIVGDPVRFVVLPDIGGVPDTVPIIDVTTTLDVVDGAFTTSQPSLTRKHVTIPATPLPAGTYWFYVAGVNPLSFSQATGLYDDDEVMLGNDADPDLEQGSVAFIGDCFFQIEGSVGDEACCFPDGSCTDLEFFECQDAGGVPQGPGTSCIAVIEKRSR